MCIFRDALPYGLFMFVYEYLVERLRSPALVRSYHYKEPTVDSWRTAAAGACAGMLSWMPGIPFDVIKTKMMTATDPNQYKSVWHCYKQITKVRIFYYGFGQHFNNSNIYFISGAWIPIFVSRWYSFGVAFGSNKCCIVHRIRKYVAPLSEPLSVFMIVCHRQNR